MVKYLLYAAATFLLLGITIAKEMVDAMGMKTDYMVIALVALVITWLMVHKKVFLVALVAFLAVLANLPPETLANLGIHRDVLLAALVAVIVAPEIYKHMS